MWRMKLVNERREAPRLRVTVEARLTVDGYAQAASITDLSACGVGLEVSVPPDVGDIVTVALTLDGEGCRVCGHVTRVEARGTQFFCAVDIRATAAGVRRRIGAYVARGQRRRVLREQRSIFAARYRGATIGTPVPATGMELVKRLIPTAVLPPRVGPDEE